MPKTVKSDSDYKIAFDSKSISYRFKSAPLQLFSQVLTEQ